MRSSKARLLVLGALLGACRPGGGGSGGDSVPLLDPLRSTVKVDKSTGVIADGADAVTITISLRDGSDSPVVGATVAVSVTGAANSIEQPAGPSDAEGVAVAVLRSTAAELKTVSVVADGMVLGDQPTVQFVAGKPSAVRSTVLATPATVFANGTATALLRARIRDGFDNPVPGATVNFSASGSGNLLTQPVLTDIAGEATGLLASTVVQLKSVTATVDVDGQPVELADSATVQFVLQPSAKFAYVVNNTDGTISRVSIGSSTGRLRGAGFSVSGGAYPVAFAFSADERFAWSVSQSSDSVSTYLVDAESGALAPGSSAPTGPDPMAFAVTPDGRFAYVANAGGDSISAYTVDGPSGDLTPSDSAATGSTPVALVMHPSGDYLYAANYNSGDVSAYAINPVTGHLVPLQDPVPAGTLPVAIALHPSGDYLYTANSASDDISMFRVDASTGVPVPIGALPAGAAPAAIAIDPEGRYAFVANSLGDDLNAYRIDPLSGALTVLGSVPTAAGPLSVRVDPSGRFLVAASVMANELQSWTIGEDGALSPSGTVRIRGGPVALAFTRAAAITGPGPEFMHVVENATPAVRTFAVGNTGSLTEVGTLALPTQPFFLTAGPAANRVYGASFGGPSSYSCCCGWSSCGVGSVSNGVGRASWTTVDPSSGLLTERGDFDIPSGFRAYSIAVDLNGRFAYAAGPLVRCDAWGCSGGCFCSPGSPGTSNVRQLRIDPVSGALTDVAGFAAGNTVRAIAAEPSGQYLFSANSGANQVGIFRIDPATGGLSPVGSVAAGVAPVALAIDTSGRRLYVVNQGSNSVILYSIGLTGTLEALGDPVPTGAAPTGITFDAAERLAFVANSSSNTVTVYAVDAATGALSQIGNPAPAGTSPRHVVVESRGRFAYALNAGSSDITQYAIDPSTGELSPFGTVVLGAGSAPVFGLSLGGTPESGFGQP